jgi:hypothetical protein
MRAGHKGKEKPEGANRVFMLHDQQNRVLLGQLDRTYRLRSKTFR